MYVCVAVCLHVTVSLLQTVAAKIKQMFKTFKIIVRRTRKTVANASFVKKIKTFHTFGTTMPHTYLKNRLFCARYRWRQLGAVWRYVTDFRFCG